MANKALKEARKAYNRNKSTKNRIDIETGKKIKKKKKPETKSHYGQVDTKNKKIGVTDAKKALDKNKTDKNPVKAHYGQVESKTRNTTGSLAAKVTNTYKANTKSAQENKSKVASSHFGQVTQSKIDQSEKAGKKKFGVGTYSTADAKKAKTKGDKAQEKLNKKGEKTVQTLSDADLKAEQDKAEDRAKRETAWYTRQLMARGRMTQGEADEAVKKAGENARKKTKEDHSLTYSNATMSNEDILREMNAAPHANVKVKDTKEADKAKREARFYTNREVAAGNMTQEEADKIIKQAGKGHWTTQSANILDKLGGEGTAEESGTRQAGQMNDSKFFSGVLQGMSYGDNTRAIGKYNQQAAELVDTVKQSGAYNTGYMTGQGLQFMLGGTNKMTDALVKGVAKSGAMRSALNVGLRKGAADVMFETPINTLDALKMSTDANGNFDKNAFVKYLALNTGLSGGMGGLIGGAGSKLAKKDAKDFISLSAKVNSGAGLSGEEVKRFGNLQKKFESIRQGNDVAKTDIVNKADYDAEVGKKVFENGGTADDAIKVVNKGGTHTEKIGYANSIKETANAEFEQLRIAREEMLNAAKSVPPEEAAVLRREAAKISKEIDRLGEIANVAEKQLAIELKRNKKAVAELAENVKGMSEATGVNYRVVDDKQMRKIIEDAGGEVSDDYFYKGFYYKNKDGQTEILINADSPQAHQTVIGHETGHLIKSANEKEFNDLGNMLEEYAKKNDDFDAVYNQLKRSYPDATEAELREEVTCELLGRYVYGKDDTFIKQLAGEQPSVLKQIVDYIKKLISGTTDKEMAKELKAIIDKTEELLGKINTTAKAEEPKYAKKYTPRSLDDITPQEYNKYAWAKANDVLSDEELGMYMKHISDVKLGKDVPWIDIPNGKMIAVGKNLNTLIVTDSNWDNPSIVKVIKINSENGNVIEDITDEITNLERNGVDTTDKTLQEYFDNIFTYQHKDDFPNYREFTTNRERAKSEGNQRGDRELEDRGRSDENAEPVAKHSKEQKPPQGGSFDENNIGYHAGDLGKAESMGNQTGGRGTGHFGTGTYFVGNKVKIDGYNARDGKPAPVETVNFGKYNLYKPHNTEEAYALHDFLRDVNDYFELVDSPKTERNFVRNINRRTDDLDYKLWDAQDELESLNKSVKSMDDDSLLAAEVAEQRVYELREELYELGKDALGESRVGKLIGEENPKQLSEKSANEILWDLQHPDDGGWYNNWKRPLAKVSSFYDGLDLWAIRLNTSKDKLLDAMREAKRQSDSLPLGSDKRYTADSASTLLMKKLGYEGVDVRHTDLDNTTYGSVIYDLKGEDLARKKEIGTARFSKEAKPKKSLYNYSNEKPEQKISKRVEALQKENDAQIKTMTTSNNADEVVEALAKSDEVEAKIEGLGSTPRRGESPKTETPKEETPKEAKKTEAQKLSENKYASDEVKTALKDIEDAGVYKEDAEKVAKKFNDLDGKIGGLVNRIEKAKNKDYPTEAEKTAHIAELEDELKTLRSQQAKAAGKLEQMGKMKAVDDSVDPQEQFHKLRGDTGKVNRELKNDSNLKNEDKWIKDKWNSVRRLWEDSLIEVENVAKRSGTDKKLREEILTAANRVRNSQNVANFWITKGRSSFDNKLTGKSLDEIFPKELVENEAKYKDFQEYLIMKHVPARHAKGTDIYPEVSPELADKIVKKLEKDYGEELTKWADDVYGYLKDLQQYRVDSGMLSKEAADKFAKDYPFYVPTNRANDDEAIDFFTGGLSNQIRTAKGGTNDVLDMYAQLYTATNKTIHAAEENQMLNLYFRAKGVTPEQLKGAELPDLEHAVIEAKVNKKTKKASVSFFVDGKPVEFPCSHQLALGLRELDGLEFERLMNAAKVSTLYGKPFKALITDWNIVFGVRNGMRDMQQAVVNSKDTRYFGSSFGAAAHAVAHDDSPYRKLYASMGGERAQLVSYDAVAKNLGIEKQGKVDAIHEKVQDWVDASVNVKGKEIHTNPVHLIEGVNGAIEMMPRMCEFIGTLRKQADKALKQQGSSLKKLRKEIIAEVDAMEKAGKIGQSEKSAKVEDMLAQKVIDMAGKDTIDTAMRNANDITLNFGRSGVLGKALNMGFVPYLNPSIQGLSKLVRLFTEAGGEGGWKALASLGMKLGTFTITPAVLNEVLLKDNEDYQNLNTRDKDNNFFIPLDKFGETWEGKFFKFPKPRENAVLAEPVEYGLRYFLDKSEYAFFDWDKLTTEDVPLWEKIPLTDEGKQSLRTALDNIGVINPATSNMFSPLWQTFNNKTWYGGSIESAYETSVNDETGKPNVPVNERYDVSTTGLAIWLGQTKGAKALNLSPKKIDNILDSYTGMVYDLYLSQTTEEAKTRGNYLFRTVASQFVKDSVFSNKLSTKAWEKMDGMTKKEQDAYKSKYMYDTFKYDDAMDVITADKNMTVQEKMDAKRALMIKKNKLNRAAINGEENNSNPLKDISKYLGANKTLNNFLPKSGDEDYDNWTDYYKNYKKTKGFKNLTPAQKEKQAQKFLDVYTLGVKGQSKISGDFHDSPSWSMTGVAAAQRYKQGKLSEKDAKTIMESCGVYESQTESYFKYADHGGNVSRYAVTKKNNNKAEALAEELGVPKKGSVWENKYSKEKGIKGGVLSMSLATGKADFKDRAYYISNSGDKNMLIKMNAARGYSEKYGHTTKQLIKLGKKADTDGNTYLSNEEIESACMTIKKGKATSEERAMAWVLLGGNPNKNPFGAIGNYAHDGDTGITADDDGKSGGGGRRGRGRRGRGGGGGGSSKGTMPKTDTGAIKGKVTDVFATSNGSKDSNLNDAYRKKVRKLRGQLNKR